VKYWRQPSSAGRTVIVLALYRKRKSNVKQTWHKRQANILSETQSVLKTFPTSWFLDLFLEKFHFVRLGFLITLLLKIDILWDIMACELVNSYWCLQYQCLPLHYLTLKGKPVISFNPLFTDWVQNVPRHGIFFNNSRWYNATILPIFLLVHWSPIDTK